MTDLAKYSVTGLDGVPRIDPIFTIPIPQEPIQIQKTTWIREDSPGDTAGYDPGSQKIKPYTSIVADPFTKAKEPNIKPENNVLHSYASYTYGLSLHLLSVQTYNNLLGKNGVSANELFNYVPENVLVASGGRLGLNSKISDIETGTIINQPQRHPFWQENFYFEELKFRTVIAPTKASRGTNVVEGTLQILEPNGFTFINRLIQTVLNVNPGSNYIFNPYMLQIDFYGMNANTEGSTLSQKNPIKLDGLKKLIPICMTTIKTRVSTRGTLYTIDFVPYSHRALNQMYNVSPANFTVPATTVQEFFNSNSTEETTYAISQQREREVTLSKLKAERAKLSANDIDLVSDRFDQQIETYQRLVKGGINVNGFCAAFNEYKKALVREHQDDIADTIEIQFDKRIGDAKLTKDASITQAIADRFLEVNKILLAQGGQGNNTINFDGALITVPAGTIIDKLIEFVIRNSEYFLNQITPYNAITRENPLWWYKIIPRVELGPYNRFRKTFSIKTVYYVIPYAVYGSAHPYVGNGMPSGQVKKYDYIFTGKNTDVMDLTIDFNLLYNLSMPVNRTQENTASGLGSNDIEGAESLAVPVQTISYQPDVVQPYTIHLHSGQTKYQGISGSIRNLDRQELAASVLHSINLESRGDMIMVKLKIIGDPDFIKQDDIFYNSAFYQKTEQKIFANGGSLWMDPANVTIQLNINSPTDYDDTTGVALTNTDPYGGIFTYNAFSGIYKVITIENLFYKGKFEQTLDIARSPIQSNEQLRSTDVNLQNQRAQIEKSLQLARSAVSNKPTNLLNIPLRSTSGTLGKSATALFGQQTAVNGAANTLATLNNVVGGLAAAPAILTQAGVMIASRVVSQVVGKGISNAVSAIESAFNPVNTAFNAADFEPGFGLEGIPTALNPLEFEAGFGLEGAETFASSGADLVAAFGF